MVANAPHAQAAHQRAPWAISVRVPAAAMTRTRLIPLALGLCVTAMSAFAQASPDGPSYANDARVRAFAESWAQANGQSFAQVWGVLRQAKRRDNVIQLVKPAPNVREKNWAEYRRRFITPHRIARGLKFWREHAGALARAQRRYGVEAHIIVGILGVETIFGQYKGRVRTLDALTTLAFDFPAEHPRAEQRQAYFQGELGDLLRLSQASARAASDWRGSYAGALGYPQFMPSSWLRWGVDFDANGRVDLVQSPVDAIGSVAHYLAEHGWQHGLPARWPTTLKPLAAADTSPETTAMRQARAQALQPDIVPTLDAAALAAAGAALPKQWVRAEAAPNAPLALVELHNGATGEPSHVIGSPNFYAITRYNQSSYYALAVIELGEAIAEARQRASSAKPAPKAPAR